MGKKTKKTLYLAYGSNINLEQMKIRCPTAKRVDTAVLNGYELEFRGVATIVPKQDAAVPMLLWELEQTDERALDRYEGYPRLYRKETLEVEVNGEKYEAMAYLMNGGSTAPPSRSYYEGIRAGYLANDMDTRFLEEALERSYVEFQNRSVSVFDDEYDEDDYYDIEDDYDEEEDEDFCFGQE